MKHLERHAPRARTIRLVGLIAGFAACAAALSGTRVEAWSHQSPMMRAAAHYMPLAAGMVAASEPKAAAAPPAVAPAHSPSPPVRVERPVTGRRARALSVWNKPMREAWPAEHEWTPAIEDDYSRFVTAIGRGIVSRRCIHLDDCLNNPAINPLYDSAEMRLGLMPDCADLPYMLRGYFAFKRHLPFGFVAAMGGEGGDPRYLHRGIPVLWRQWTDFRSPRAFFDEMPSFVHSGMFRLSPKIEEGDTYAPEINRDTVRPGAMYYDTDGHVLVVSEVFPDGNIQFIDGHPGGSISHPRFDAPRQTPPGSALWGGGFRVWRPQRLAGNTILRARNWGLRDFAPFHQYDRSNYVVGGAPVAYDDWVRDALVARR